MQVYDEANALARQIRESEVCVSYRQMKEEIAQDATNKALIDEYKKLQMQLYNHHFHIMMSEPFLISA